MAWTDPRTWVAGELVTATLMNAHVRDNLDYLLDPNHEQILRDNSGDYSISSVTTFQDIDGTNLTFDIDTHGGPVLVEFCGTAVLNDGENAYFDVAVDGTRYGTAFAHGLSGAGNTGTGGTVRIPVSMVSLITGLAAGTYTLRPQWRTDTGDTPLLVSNSTEGPVRFSAIEL